MIFFFDNSVIGMDTLTEDGKMTEIDKFRIVVKMGLARKEMKQYKLAQKLGLNPAYFSQVLHGIAPLSDNLRERVMDELELNPWEVL